MAMAGPAIVTSNLAGSDLVMTAGIVNTFAFQLVTVKSITSPNQLKGKRIGVNRFGAAPDVAARYALNHLKIDPREVTVLQMGEQSTRLEAMKAGQLDAAILLPPITTIAQKNGMNILLDMSELGGEFLITGLASSQKFLIQNRASATRLMRPSSKAFIILRPIDGRAKKSSRVTCARTTWKRSVPLGTTSQPRSCHENLMRQ
jgi:NitT/TauT family transport system substrate-binding protein